MANDKEKDISEDLIAAFTAQANPSAAPVQNATPSSTPPQNAQNTPEQIIAALGGGGKPAASVAEKDVLKDADSDRLLARRNTIPMADGTQAIAVNHIINTQKASLRQHDTPYAPHQKVNFYADDEYATAMRHIKDQVIQRVQNNPEAQALFQKSEWGGEDRVAWEKMISTMTSEEMDKIPGLDRYRNADSNKKVERPPSLNELSEDIRNGTQEKEFDCDPMSVSEGYVLQKIEEHFLPNKAEGAQNLKFSSNYFVVPGAYFDSGLDGVAGHAYIVSSTTGNVIEATAYPSSTDQNSPYGASPYRISNGSFSDLIAGRQVVAHDVDNPQKIHVYGSAFSSNEEVVVSQRMANIREGDFDDLSSNRFTQESLGALTQHYQAVYNQGWQPLSYLETSGADLQTSPPVYESTWQYSDLDSLGNGIGVYMPDGKGGYVESDMPPITPGGTADFKQNVGLFVQETGNPDYVNVFVDSEAGIVVRKDDFEALKVKAEKLDPHASSSKLENKNVKSEAETGGFLGFIQNLWSGDDSLPAKGASLAPDEDSYANLRKSLGSDSRHFAWDAGNVPSSSSKPFILSEGPTISRNEFSAAVEAKGAELRDGCDPEVTVDSNVRPDPVLNQDIDMNMSA